MIQQPQGLASTYLKRLNLFGMAVSPSASEIDRMALLDRANRAAAKVEGVWADYKASGGLKELHARYRQYRHECERKGVSTQRWAWFEAEARRQMVRALADKEKM
jgi:hypothetical protein